MLAIVVLSLLTGSRPDLVQRRMDQLAAPYAWSAIAWEATYLPTGVGLLIGQVASSPPSGLVQSDLRAYLDGSPDCGTHNADSTAEAPSTCGAASAPTLARAVGDALRDSGASTIGDLLVPPVLFTEAVPPRLLVISPRDRIELTHSVLLRGDVSLAEAESLERSMEQLDVSALVVDIGGISTYPALIPPNGAPASTLGTIAHEWTHAALFLSPLGRAYGSSPDARAINETAADLVAQEVVARIVEDAGAELPQQEADNGGRELRDTMRRIRVTVDALLAERKVPEAEATMEAERQTLVDHGFLIRRLNQAYFAFHGNYAEGPAPSTEVPDLLRALRAQAASLNEFLDRIGRTTSLDELRREVAQRGAS
ncbi:MAG: hypothetical protein GEU73_12700 [Chloroflexi bacterium]|nr:hypothetical protein [Chloroflexota bacterium]